MTVYVHDSQFFTRRGAVVVAILALHVLIVWALVSGLAHRLVEAVAPPLQTEIVQEEQKKFEPPPPPPPTFEKPPVEVPPPDVTIDMPVEAANNTAISAVTTKHVEAAAAPKASVRTAMKIDTKHFPTSDEFYPPASRRLNEEGAPVVHICLGPDGKLAAGSPSIATSVNPRLDQGALELAKAGARYISPATEDGKPVAACTDLRIKFQLH